MSIIFLFGDFCLLYKSKKNLWLYGGKCLILQILENSSFRKFTKTCLCQACTTQILSKHVLNTPKQAKSLSTNES